MYKFFLLYKAQLAQAYIQYMYMYIFFVHFHVFLVDFVYTYFFIFQFIFALGGLVNSYPVMLVGRFVFG